ncbi:MAG: hypothetical protein HY904_08655 [Deltaproteobacteria bacterium]|nr:hypothetical protein [Deltaproteobacteria bacterium]
MRRFNGWVGVLAAVLLGSACVVGMEEDGPSGIELMCGSQAGEALRVCADGTTVRGVDVSYWQGSIDWERVKGAGMKFGIARISDGTRHVDTQFGRNWRQMKAQGLVRGAYQFFRSNQDPIAQARLVVRQLNEYGGLDDADMPVVLDLETRDGMSNATIVSRARQWLRYVEQHTGKRPIIYTAAMMSSTLGSNLSDYKLWVANWTTSCPTMPSGWRHWVFWQYTSDGSVAGISGRVDTNRFNGDLAELRSWARATTVGGGQTDPTPDPTPPPPQRCSQLKVIDLNSGRLNIRPTAGTTRSPLGTLGEFETAPILDRAQGEQIGNTRLWLKVRSPRGVTGWVTARYVRCNNAGTLAEEDALWEDLGFEALDDVLEGRVMGDGDMPLPEDTEVVAPVCGFGW